MAATGYAHPIRQALEFFNRTISVFNEDDSGYAPMADQ